MRWVVCASSTPLHSHSLVGDLTILHQFNFTGNNKKFKLDFFAKDKFLLQMRPSVQELLCMPYVSQYVQKYAEHIMQLPDITGDVPSLNLDQLPIIKHIRR